MLNIKEYAVYAKNFAGARKEEPVFLVPKKVNGQSPHD